MKEISITEGLGSSIWSSLDIAIENNNAGTIHTFITFFRKILRNSIIHNDLKNFNEFIVFTEVIYTKIIRLQKQNLLKGEKILFIADEMSRHLNEVTALIAFYIKSKTEHPAKNEYYYSAFRSFNNLFYWQTRLHDWNGLESSLKRYDFWTNQIVKESASKNINEEKLNSENLHIEYSEDIEKIDITKINQSVLNSYQRQTLSALKSWLYLLYDENILDAERLDSLLRFLETSQIHNLKNEINDLFFFRTSNLRKYMGWENWDIIERPEMESYEPPVAAKWLTEGFVLDRIRTRNTYFDISNVSSDLKKTIPFLYDSVKENTDKILRDFAKWKIILRVKDKEEFHSIAERLLAAIGSVKRDVVGSKEVAIASEPLDKNIVSWFKEETGRAWRLQTRVRRIFDLFNNTQNVTGKDILLKRVGTNNMLERGKVHFIEGEHHSNIYGLDHFGATVGRWEDNLFMDAIEKSNPIVIEENSLIKILTKGIQMLEKQSVSPTAIILEPEYFYKDEEFINSEKYSRYGKLEEKLESNNFFLIGEFDGIPIFSLYSPQLKNKVIISNFSEAFLMQYKTNDQWYDKQLSIIVSEVPDAVVDKKYRENPNKWNTTDEGIKLSEADAKLIIKNSIIIDVETIMDFVIKDSTKFIVGQITEPLQD